MSYEPIYMPGDAVFYVGEKFKERLGGKRGWIHARTETPGVFVVEFPDTRDSKDPKDTDDYVMSYKVINKWRPSEKEKKSEGPEIQPRRKRSEDE